MADFPAHAVRTLVDLFRWRAERDGDRPAFKFLERGEVQQALTWRQLDEQARRTAALLQSHGVRPGDRVPISYPSGLDYIVAIAGVLYAGAIALPLPQGNARRLAFRLGQVVADSRARCVIAPGDMRQGFVEAAEHRLADARWLDLGERHAIDAAAWRALKIDAEDTAVLQYTSGSIGDPKACVVSHRNVLCNEETIRVAFGHDHDTVVVGWLPFYHDMGLFGNILQSVYVGCPCILFSSTEFFREPLRWMEAITRFGGTTSGGPSFAYEMCARRAAPEEVAQWDLRSWRLAFNGAEPIQAETLSRFARAFAPSGFRPQAMYPCYGMAEATLFVTGAELDREPTLLPVDALALQLDRIASPAHPAQAQTLVSCGKPGTGVSVAIVDPQRRVALADGRIGEIWVHGPGVVAGYFEKPQASEETFRARLQHDLQRDYLRTGDLGCLIDGELYVTGRLKDLIILRGRNYHPHDIERVAERAHASIRAGSSAAFAVADVDGERLVLVCEIEHRTGFEPQAAADTVRAAIAEHLDVGVHTVVFVRAGQVPKTTSGKIRRQACRQLFLDDALVRLEPRKAVRSEPEADEPASVLAQQVLAAAAGLLGRPAADLPRHRSLPALGMDSLMMARLALLLEAQQLMVPLALLHEVGGLDELIAYCQAHPHDPRARRPSSPAPARAPLSHGQRSLWLHAQLFPASRAYHLAWTARLTGALDVDRLAAAFLQLQRTHEALRMRVEVVAGEPWQHWDSPPAQLIQVDARHCSDLQLMQQLAARADTGFELQSAAPIEAVLYARSDREHVLLLRAHHIAVDLGSLPILMHAWQAACGDAVHPHRSRPHAGDDVQREIDYLASADAHEDTEYWRDRLHGYLALPAALPGRRKRALDRRQGAATGWPVAPAVVEGFGRLGRDLGCTAFDLHLAVYAAMLAHWTGRTEVVVGVPFDLREGDGSSDAIGYCVNLLPIVVEVNRTQSFRAFAARVRKAVLAARKHARLPLDAMAQRLGAAREPGQVPFVDAVFVWRTLGAAAQAWHAPGRLDARLAGAAVEVMALDERGAQFDFSMVVTETGTGTGLSAKLVYDPQVLDGENIDRAAERLQAQYRAVADDADTPLSALALLGADERQLLLTAFDGPRRTYPAQATLLSLLLEQAARTPAAVALCGTMGGPVCGDARPQWTYAQLHAIASRVAARLRQRGYGGRDALVGVAIDRSAAMVVAILAAIHAGAAYLPLDPDEPDDHLRQLLQASGCGVVLSTAAHRSRAAFADVEFVDIGVAGAAAAQPLSADIGCRPDDLAYVIHTSGSTGQPKGVMIEHRAIVNRLLWMAETFELDARQVFLHKTPVTFDVSVWELFLPLLLGARLVLLATGGERDPPVLIEHMRRFDVSIAHFVPSMLLALLAHLPAQTRLPAWSRCICSGEALEPHLRDRFVDAFGDTALINLYGPTEAAVDVTWHVVGRDEADIPIGRAAANVRLRILDADERPVPIGTPGELCICGTQVARGYLNRPEATARAFGVDPVDGVSPLYRTGDFARWRGDGSVEYLGRRDSQIKIRGRRVELGEIEQALCACPGVLGAAVATRSDAHGDLELVAFLLGETLPPLEAVLAFLRQRLPRPLIPSAFARVDVLPLTRSGKLDRGRLPFQALQRPRAGFEPPRTPQEHALCRIWAAELAVAPVGVDDNFFDLGGDSIRALRIVAAGAREQLNFTVADLFARPRVRALAERLQASVAAAIPAPQPFELIPAQWRDRLPADVEDAYPLSYVQRSLVYLSETSPVYEIYVTSLRMKGRCDPQRLAECMRHAAQRHPFLRVSFDLVAFAEGVQRVHRDVEVPFQVLDRRDVPATAQARELHEWMLAERKRRFDWNSAPMLRFTVHRWSEHEFQFSLSDAAFDGWCVASLITEVLEEYAALCEGRPLQRTAPVTRYADFIALERAAVADDGTRAFWHDKARRFGAGALRRPERTPLQGQHLQGRVSVAFAAEVHDAAVGLARALSVPLKSVLLATHMRVLSALCGRRVVSGLEVNGRPEGEDGDRVIGVFNNTVVLCLELQDASWSALIRDCWRAEQELQPYRRYPYHQLRKDFGQTPFDAVFVYTDFHVYQRIVGAETFQVLSASASDQTFFALTAHFNRDVLSGSLQLLLDFDPGQWSEASVRALAQAYRDNLAAMLADPAAAHAGRAVASSVPVPAVSGPRQHCLPELIGAQARRHPDRVAIVCGDTHVSYAALWRDAEQIALALRERGLGPEALVGVDLQRSVDLIAALLGIWLCGAAFVPLNPGEPFERRERIARDSLVALVLTDHAHALAWPVPACTLPSLRGSARRYRRVRSPADPRNVAYAIYTSGSTGAPKGVLIQHDSLANYVAWAVAHYGLDGGDVPVHTATSFDLTITSQIAPLTVGATLRLMADADGVAELATELMHGPGAALIKLTPSHLDYLARATQADGIAHPPERLVVGGEALRAQSLHAWRRHGTRIFNEYGPTEATVGCCVHEIGQDDPEHGSVAIGAPVAPPRLVVVAAWGEPLAPGLVGELWISGTGLARGYHGAPAATADRFRPDPFAAGARAYRSGDLAFVNDAGLFEYVGRSDRQLKIRGFRIEPSEIEAALLSHPQLVSAAVVARRTAAGTMALAAHVVARNGQKPQPQALRTYLAARLSEPMLPATIAVVDALPLTRNGKIDYPQLAAAAPDERERLRELLQRIESASAEEIALLLSDSDP
ncbi:amino acid adenylation domain-containing protein [Xanthomonas hortorum pv. hederae]|uniref:Amino acid adenylation domain-containing protein n=1 Tax=Xanthomonas hortorum pv. hederae TaxID=453603 RepID=A0A9X4BSP6_9XANT|nr:non-ribosomal peptide synthetase [Xanthomonas hortorum]MDC8638897.1 amino acid adenylation domain-containing protein [Xanthomonas hortorum pv. hederae]